MTIRPFDASASITRPASSAQDAGRRPSVRLGWLIARFVRREPVRYDIYAKRFGRSARSFRYDVVAVRKARIYRGTELLGSSACITSDEVASHRGGAPL